MKSIKVLSAVLLLSGLLILGQARGALSAGVVQPLASAVRTQSTTVQAGWEKRWEETLAAAKKEGEVEIYLNAPTDTRIALADAFSKKFGLKLNVMMGSGGDLEVKLISEYRSGIHQVDLFMPGATSTTNAKKLGILSPIEPLFILPEVREPKVWINGKLPFFDRDGMIVAFLSLKNPNVIYNADLVKDGEITSYLDLLKSQWKGKTVMYDPTRSGAAQAGSANLALEWGSNEKAYEYIVSLIKQQDTIVTRDMRLQVEWVARGKYPVALWPQVPATNQFLKVGAHLAAAPLKEKGRVTPGNGGLTIPMKPPHPHAATIFLNWFLSREGQTLAVKVMAAPSSRTDVSTEGIAPMFIPQPGEQNFVQDEETTLARAPFIEGLKKVFSQLNK